MIACRRTHHRATMRGSAMLTAREVATIGGLASWRLVRAPANDLTILMVKLRQKPANRQRLRRSAFCRRQPFGVSHPDGGGLGSLCGIGRVSRRPIPMLDAASCLVLRAPKASFRSELRSTYALPTMQSPRRTPRATQGRLGLLPRLWRVDRALSCRRGANPKSAQSRTFKPAAADAALPPMDHHVDNADHVDA